MIVLTLDRKPLIGSVAANDLKHGTGGINVDGSRIVSSVDARINSPGDNINSLVSRTS